MDTALARSEYDPNVPSFFGWLGVTFYLNHDAVFDTLNAIKRVTAAGSQVVFDYLDTDAFDPRRSSQAMQELIQSFRSSDPLIAAFDSETLESELSRIGFSVRENLRSLDIEALYFRDRTDGYHAMEHACLAWVVVE